MGFCVHPPFYPFTPTTLQFVFPSSLHPSQTDHLKHVSNFPYQQSLVARGTARNHSWHNGKQSRMCHKCQQSGTHVVCVSHTHSNVGKHIRRLPCGCENSTHMHTEANYWLEIKI